MITLPVEAVWAIDARVANDSSRVRYMVTPSQLKKLCACGSSPDCMSFSDRSSWVKSTGTNCSCDGFSQPQFFNSLTFKSLHGRMVDLKNLQAFCQIRTPKSKSIHPRSEDHVLPEPLLHSLFQMFFHIS